VEGTDYLRLSAKNYVRTSTTYSHGEVAASDGTNNIKFDEVVSLVAFDQFAQSAPPEIRELPGLQGKDFNLSGFYKHCELKGTAATEAVSKLPLLYFPYFRYERPYWLSKAANVDFAKSVALSKSAFITTIVDNSTLSANFDRSAFRAIFDIISAIIGPAPASAPTSS